MLRCSRNTGFLPLPFPIEKPVLINEDTVDDLAISQIRSVGMLLLFICSTVVAYNNNLNITHNGNHEHTPLFNIKAIISSNILSLELLSSTSPSECDQKLLSDAPHWQDWLLGSRHP